MTTSVEDIVRDNMENQYTEEPHHGDPFFYEQCREEANLHSRKNYDYAAGGDVLGNFYRVSTILGLYPGLDLANPVVVCIVYMLKQLDAILWGLAKGIQHKVEGFHPRLQDVGIYAKITRCLLKRQESIHVPTPTPFEGTPVSINPRKEGD